MFLHRLPIIHIVCFPHSLINTRCRTSSARAHCADRLRHAHRTRTHVLTRCARLRRPAARPLLDRPRACAHARSHPQLMICITATSRLPTHSSAALRSSSAVSRLLRHSSLLRTHSFARFYVFDSFAAGCACSSPPALCSRTTRIFPLTSFCRRSISTLSPTSSSITPPVRFRSLRSFANDP